MMHEFSTATIRATALAGVLALLICAQSATADSVKVDTAAHLAAARAASKDLGETLKSKLVTAIQDGGVASAIAVCNTIAPSIAADASNKYNVTIRRTALKIRNPDNAPDAFETRVLEDFVRRIEAGADPTTLEYSETVTESGTIKFRYMKAIPTAAEPCLACHGSGVKPDVKAAISKLYPADQATGFKAGDLRGAFSVTQPLN